MNGIICFDSASGNLLLYRKFLSNFGLPLLKPEFTNGKPDTDTDTDRPPKAAGSASARGKTDGEIAGDLALELYALQRFGSSGSNTRMHEHAGQNQEFLMCCDICPPQAHLNFHGVRAFCAHDTCPQDVTAAALVNPCMIPANVAHDLAECVFGLVKSRPTVSTPRGTVSERHEFSEKVSDLLCSKMLFDWSDPQADAVFKLNANLLPADQHACEAADVEVVALPPRPPKPKPEPIKQHPYGCLRCFKKKPQPTIQEAMKLQITSLDSVQNLDEIAKLESTPQIAIKVETLKKRDEANDSKINLGPVLTTIANCRLFTGIGNASEKEGAPVTAEGQLPNWRTISIKRPAPSKGPAVGANLLCYGNIVAQAPPTCSNPDNLRAKTQGTLQAVQGVVATLKTQ